MRVREHDRGRSTPSGTQREPAANDITMRTTSKEHTTVGVRLVAVPPSSGLTACRVTLVGGAVRKVPGVLQPLQPRSVSPSGVPSELTRTRQV